MVKVNEVGEIVIVDKHQSTSCLEIVAAGGITDSPYKQAIISARDGAKAILIAYNYMQGIKKTYYRSNWKQERENKLQ